ncbi:MAG: formamidopyrimidine-DNA glycosylase [Chlamydiia bacterium]|nr:formamidopyrimidine-DNA glycosylase [Chlamydiia bacterium]
MPELPEVETVVRNFVQSKLFGTKITEVVITCPSLLADQEQFIKEITGDCITGCARRGKYILLTLSSGKTLLVHLRMTGKLLIVKKSPKKYAHERAALILEGEHDIRFLDARKFGRFDLTESAEEFLKHLGLEPLDKTFSLEAFSRCMLRSKRMLKALLLDQTVVAGLGNIYADESLFQAAIHPARAACTLAQKELKNLHKAIIDVLTAAIERGGSSLGRGQGNFLNAYGSKGENQHAFYVYRRTGRPCLHCSVPIERIVISQRSTHFCPHCQK